MPEGWVGFVTAEEAAVSGFPAVAKARVLTVRSVHLAIQDMLRPGARSSGFRGDGEFVEVDVDTDPSHPYVVVCYREGDQWFEYGGHN